MMNRLEHWRVHFDAFLTERARQPFAWGRNDCAIFAADAVQAVTGVDLAGRLRGATTARQAVRLLRRHGDLLGIASAALGAPVGVHQAQEADVLLVRMGRRSALGVRLADDVVVGPGLDGLQAVPLQQALCAWRVG